ncbi:unnamed protein product [Bathycoccus prasinos]
MSTLMHQRHLLLLEKKHRRKETTWFVTKSALKKGETRKKNFHVVRRRLLLCCLILVTLVLYSRFYSSTKTTTAKKMQTTTRRRRAGTVKEFVGCNDDKDGNEDDEDGKKMDAKDFVLRSIETTRVRSKPFASYVHLCRVFPTKLYREMTEYFPPKEALAPAKLTSHKLRYKIDRVGSLLDLPEAMRKTFKNFTKTVEVWSKAEDILLSERLRETVFRKLEVDEVEKKTRSKDFRIQVDVGGFTLGPHPDSPKKIVTLMLYFPKEEEEESNKKLFGTCLYTKEQYETFADNDEGKEVLPSCEKKFLFEPNTGYAFKVGEESYHGVDDIPPRCERRTLLINWYSTSKPVGSQSGIFPNIWDIIRGDA